MFELTKMFCFRFTFSQSKHLSCSAQKVYLKVYYYYYEIYYLIYSKFEFFIVLYKTYDVTL